MDKSLGSHMLVDWNKYRGEKISLTNVAIELLFEYLTWTNIWSESFYATSGKWNEVAKDLITYMFVKGRWIER